jgi:pyruvate ferredoxin oxidoreductase gamma subunit
MRPNALIIQDTTLLHQINLFEWLVPSGYLLINPARSFDGLGLGELIRQFPRERMLVVPATELALRHLGRPLPNAVLLGGFTAICGRISLDTVVSSIRSRFPGKVADGNVGVVNLFRVESGGTPRSRAVIYSGPSVKLP